MGTGHHHEPATIHPAMLQESRRGWKLFTKYTTFSVLGVVVTLLLLLIFFGR